MLFYLKNKNKILNQCKYIVFYYLKLISFSKSKYNKIFFKNNIYSLQFLNKTNKYIIIRGLVLKTINKYSNFINLGKRIHLYSKIMGEYLYFNISLDIPSLNIK